MLAPKIRLKYSQMCASFVNRVFEVNYVSFFLKSARSCGNISLLGPFKAVDCRNDCVSETI